jgi:hypothetical protein
MNLGALLSLMQGPSTRFEGCDDVGDAVARRALTRTAQVPETRRVGETQRALNRRGAHAEESHEFRHIREPFARCEKSGLVVRTLRSLSGLVSLTLTHRRSVARGSEERATCRPMDSTVRRQQTTSRREGRVTEYGRNGSRSCRYGPTAGRRSGRRGATPSR